MRVLCWSIYIISLWAKDSICNHCTICKSPEFNLIGRFAAAYLAHGTMCGGVQRGQILECRVVRCFMVVATIIKQIGAKLFSVERRKKAALLNK